MVMVTFGTLAMSLVAQLVFNCVVTSDFRPFRATLLEECFPLVGKLTS